MRGAPNLGQLIAAVNDSLTPTERRVAQEVLRDPTAVAFGTVAELARRVETSGPTIVRFATKLGFDGFASLQNLAREQVTDRLTRATDRIRTDADASVWEQARATVAAAVSDTFDSVTERDLIELAEPVAQASGQVWIVAAESSAAAHVLANGLALVRPGVRHLTGSRAALATMLTDAGPDDVALAIDFDRHETDVADTVRVLAELDVTILAITDGALSPIAGPAEAWCQVAVPAVGPFDSDVPAVIVAELLVAQVAHLLREHATERLDRAEQLWVRTDVFVANDAAPDGVES